MRFISDKDLQTGRFNGLSYNYTNTEKPEKMRFFVWEIR
mgnify:CR=1 FL=1